MPVRHMENDKEQVDIKKNYADNDTRLAMHLHLSAAWLSG